MPVVRGDARRGCGRRPEIKGGGHARPSIIERKSFTVRPVQCAWRQVKSNAPDAWIITAAPPVPVVCSSDQGQRLSSTSQPSAQRRRRPTWIRHVLRRLTRAAGKSSGGGTHGPVYGRRL